MAENRTGPTDWLSGDPVTIDGKQAYRLNVNIIGGAGSYTGPLAAQLPASLGIKTAAASLSIAPASDASFAVTGPMTSTQFLANLRSTGAFTSVNSDATSTTILASNANRKGAIIVNTDANILYLDLTGGTAATTRYAKALAQNEQYEVPFGVTGLITGIWAADGAGAALVTEFS